MTGARPVQTSADYLRAFHLGMDPETFLASQDLLRQQSRKLLREERGVRIRRRVDRSILHGPGPLLFTYSNSLSRFIDRLTSETEKDNHG